MTAADPKSLLKRCPRCGYSMRGLPVEHRCPECGFDVDRRWRVFGGSIFGVDTTRAVKPVRVICIGAAILFSAEAIAFLTLVLWTFLIGGPLLMAFRRPKSFIAVGPRGILIYRGARGGEHVEWRLIEPLPLDRTPGAIVLQVAGEKMILGSYEFFHWHFWEADRCVRCINSYARRGKTSES